MSSASLGALHPMLNEKLLASNVLRRIYKDSTFEAAQLRAQASSNARAGNDEASVVAYKEADEHTSVATTAYEALLQRGEALR